MYVQAIFTGENSLGYRNGTAYRLRFTVEYGKAKIKCMSHPDNESCIYDSLRLFFDNWKVV